SFLSSSPRKRGSIIITSGIWVAAFAETTHSLVQPARRLRLVVAERVELVRLVEETLDRCARDDRIGRRQQNRLPQLMVPRPHADREAFVAVEGAFSENELALRHEICRAGTERRLHHHLDRHPCRPAPALHLSTAG